MIKVSVKQVGHTFHATAMMGHVHAIAPSPIKAAKLVSGAVQDVFPGTIVIASPTGHGFLIEQIDKLEYQGTPIWMHKLGVDRSIFQ